MSLFLMSPYSIPIVIVAIVVGLPVISSTITKLAKLHYANREKENESSVDSRELEELRRRVENLETIVLELERKRE